MKYLTSTFLSLLCISMLCLFIACGGNSAEEAESQQGKEYTSAYVCPMHCEGSGSDEPGQCPVCHMDYEKNAKHNSHEHTH